MLLSHVNFHNVHDHSTNGVVSLDGFGNICYINPSAVRSFFLNSNPLGKHINQFLKNKIQLTDQFEKRLLTGLSDEEFQLLGSTGTKDVLISSMVYTDQEGEARTYLFIRDISSLKKKEYLLAHLNNAAEELAKARDTNTALAKISSLIVPRFASWFSIDLIKNGELNELVLAHEDPEMVDWARRYREAYPTDLNSNSGTAMVVKTGTPLFIPVITPAMVQASITNPVQLELVRKMNLQSVITVAIYYRKSITGIITFVSSTEGYHYDESDLDFAKSFAIHIGMSLENARLNEDAANEIIIKQQVTEALQQSEELFRFLSDAIPHKLWTSGPDGKVNYYNQRWFEYTGVTGFDELRKQVWSLLHPDDLEKAASEWPLTLANGEPKTNEQRLRNKDGEYRWHLSRTIPHKDQNGNIRLWVGTSTDIHEQKLIQEALETSEAHFRTLTQLNSLPIWQIDADGKMVFVNNTWRTFTGVQAGQVNESAWSENLHPDDRGDVLQQFNDAFSRRAAVHLKYRFLHASSGQYHWMLDNALPIYDLTFRGYIGTMTDIHEQEKARLAAQELMTKKDEFISIASHELKTPLTSIKAFNQLMQRVTDPATIRSFTLKTGDHIIRLEKLINDLLDVNKINAGKIQYNIEPFPFKSMLLESVEAARLASPNYEFVLENEVDISYNGDRFRLEQVINNFLTNAVKYSPIEKKIIVKSQVVQDNIIVSVRDFGIGIARENLDKLFDRYYRVDNTAMRFEGLGLGLFISSEILKRHSGSFWIESDLGKGSTFYFRLPLPKTNAASLISQTSTAYRDNYITINFNEAKMRMEVNWTGFQDFTSVKKGCLIMLDYLRNNKCYRIVNDNTNVLGDWADAVEWVGNEWFPMMEKAGLRYFAHIFSPSTFSAISAQKSIDIMAGIITTQYFTDVKLAEEWIDSCF
jgi:PAS domain S-box-containing protein